MNKARKPIYPLLILFGLLTLPLSSQAGIKCWTNKDGIRECGNMVPPEYAQRETHTINKRGITTGVSARAKTPKELEAERARQKEEEHLLAEEERLKDEEEKRLQKQAAYDRVLLATFLTEEDILRSRDRKLGVINATIELTHLTRDKLQKKLEREETSAARFKKRDKPVPAAIQTDIDSLRKQIDAKKAYIATKTREREDLTAKYAMDLERFRELKAEGRKLR
jgi:hypothetical protein